MRQSGNTLSMLIRQYRSVLRHSFWMNAVLANPVWKRSLLNAARSAVAGLSLAAAGTALAEGPTSTTILVDMTKGNVKKTDTTVGDPDATGTRVITTKTITGNNALNAFSRFDVAVNDTVNLKLPKGTINLINVVNDVKKSEVYGMVNSILEDTKGLGGNVYFLTSKGMVIGTTGMFNVGSLTIHTPSQGYIDAFFDGDPTSNADDVTKGKVPIGATGLITVQGTINGMDFVSLQAATITLDSAKVNAGSEAKFQFATIANVKDLYTGNFFDISTGSIKIVASLEGGLAEGGSSTSITITGSSELHADKDLTVLAEATSTNVFGGDATATVTISGTSKLFSCTPLYPGNILFPTGGTLTLGATSQVGASVEATGVNDFSDTESQAFDLAKTNIVTLLTDNLLPINAHLQTATSSITVGAGATLNAQGGLTVQCNTSFDVDFKVKGIVAGVAYGDAAANALIDIQGTLIGDSVNVLSDMKGTMALTTGNILNRLITSDSVGFDAMVAISNTSYSNQINIGPEASLTATAARAGSSYIYGVPDLAIKATTEVEESLEVEAGGADEMLCIAVGVAQRNASTQVKVDGTVGAPAVEITSEFTSTDDLNVDSYQGSHFYATPGNAIKKKGSDLVQKARDFFAKRSDAAKDKLKDSDAHKPEQPKEPGAYGKTMDSWKANVGACGAYGERSSTIDTQVNVSGTISAGSDLSIEAKTSETSVRSNVAVDVGERPQPDPNKPVPDKNLALAIGVLLDSRDNTVDTFIKGSASLSAGDQLAINATYEKPYQIPWIDDLKGLIDGNASLTWDFIKDTLPAILSADAGLPEAVFTSGVRSAAAGEEAGIAIAVNLGIANNLATVRVEDNARLKTTNSGGAVSLGSLVDAEAVNFTGDWSVPFASALKFNKDFWNGGATSEHAAIGAAYLGIFDNNSALTVVGNADIKTTDLKVTAENTGFGADIGLAGGKAGDFGFDGAITTNFYDNTTVAVVSDGAAINANGTVTIDAADDFSLYSPQGGICKGTNSGVGFSVDYTEVSRLTSSTLGFLSGDTLAQTQGLFSELDSSWTLPSTATAKSVSMTASGGLEVTAENKGFYIVAALAGTVVKPDSSHHSTPSNPPPLQSGAVDAAIAASTGTGELVLSGNDGESARNGFYDGLDDWPDVEEPTPAHSPVAEHVATQAGHSKDKLGAGISGDSAVIKFEATTEAIVRGSQNIDASGGNVTIEASNTDTVLALGGGMTVTKFDPALTGISGSFVYANCTFNTTASLANAGLTRSQNLSVDAKRSGLVLSMSASLDATSATQGLGTALAGSFNNVEGTTEASIKNGNVTATGDIEVNALDDTTVAAATGALTAGKTVVGVGGAFSWSQTDCKTLALLEQVSQINAASLSVLANNNNVLYTPSATGGVGVAQNGVGVAFSFSVNMVKDQTSAQIINSGGNTLINTGTFSLNALSGCDGKVNPWQQTQDANDAMDEALAQVKHDTGGVSDGEGNIQVSYTSNPDPDGPNSETDKKVSYTFDQAKPDAGDKIVAINLGVAVGSMGAGSLSGAYNYVSGGTDTTISGAVKMNVTQGVASLNAESSGNIIAVGVSVGGAGKGADANSIGVNIVDTSTSVLTENQVKLHLQGAGNKQLLIGAKNATSLNSTDLAVAAAGPSVDSTTLGGIATVAYNEFRGDSLVTLNQTTIQSDAGATADAQFTADISATNTGNITAVVAGGSKSGTAAGGASVGMNLLGGDTLVSLNGLTLNAGDNATYNNKTTQQLNFETNNTRDILSVSVVASLATGLLKSGSGVGSASYNQIGGNNGINANNVSIGHSNTTFNSLATSFKVTETLSGQAVVVGGSGAGSGAAAASIAINTVGDSSMSPETAGYEKSLSQSLTTPEGSGLNTHQVGVQATDLKSTGSAAVTVKGDSDWISVAVGGAGAKSVAAGLAGSYNNIGGNQEIDFTNCQLPNAGSLTLSNTSGGNILSVGAGGSGSGTFAAGVSILINNLYAKTLINLSGTQASSSSDLTLEAANQSTLLGVSVGASGSLETAVGGSGLANKLQNEVDVSVKDSSLATPGNSGASILLSAQQDNSISAVAVSGGLAGEVAVAGAVGVNLSDSTTQVSIDNSTLQADGSVAVESMITEQLNSVSTGVGLAGDASVAGTVNTNILTLKNKIEIKNNSHIQAHGSKLLGDMPAGQGGVFLQAKTAEELLITTVNAGGSFSGAVEAAVGVNTVSSSTLIDVENSRIDSQDPNGGITASATDSTMGNVVAVSVGAALDVGVSGATGINTFGQTAGVALDKATLNSAKDINLSSLLTQKDNSTIVGVGAGIAGVAASVSYGEYDGTSQVSITDSQVQAGNDLNLASKSTLTLVEATGSGAAGEGAAAAGVQVISTTGQTNTNIDGNSGLSAGGDLSLTANDNLTINSTVWSATAGVGAGSGAVNSIGLFNTTRVHTDKGTLLNAIGDLDATSNSQLTVTSSVGGVGVGGVGIGASVDVLTAQSSALVEMLGGSQAGGTATLGSSLNRKITSNTISGSVGAGAVGGAVIVAKLGPDQAVMEAPDIEDYTDTSKVLSQPANELNQVIGNLKDQQLGDLSADGVISDDLAAQVTQNFDNDWSGYKSSAESSAVSSLGQLKADSVSIKAKNSNTFNLTPTLASAGGASVGATVAYTKSTDSTLASVGGQVQAQQISINSQDVSNGTFNLAALSLGGVNVAGAFGYVVDHATSEVSIAQGTSLDAKTGALQLHVGSKQQLSDNAHLESCGAISGSGAGISLESQRKALVNIGDKATLHGQSLDIQSRGEFQQNNGSDTSKANVELPGLAAVGVSASNNVTTLANSSSVAIGQGVSLAATDALSIQALNHFETFDYLDIVSGGLFTFVEAFNTLNLDLTQTISIGGNTSLDAGGALSLETHAQGDATTKSVGRNGTVAGNANASSFIKGDIGNSITVDSNSSLSAQGMLQLLAGCDASLQDDDVSLSTDARSYANGLISIPSTTASTKLTQTNAINLAANTLLQTVGDVALLAGRDGPSLTSYYSAKWNSITSATGTGVTYDDSGKEVGLTLKSTVNVDGTVASGTQDQRYLHIDKDGNVDYRDPDNAKATAQSWMEPDFKVDPNFSINLALQDRIDKLNADIKRFTANKEDVSKYQADLDAALSLQKQYENNNYTAPLYTLTPFTLGLHDIRVGGGKLTGSGTLSASGGNAFKVLNESKAMLSVAGDPKNQNLGLQIDATKGYVYFNTVPTSTLSTFDGKLQSVLTSNKPTLSLKNTHSSKPMLEISGNLSNSHGTITLTSTGSVVVDDANITAQTLSISAGGDFVQSYTAGFNNLGGSPASGEILKPIIAAGSIYIAAEKLNLNSILRSGRDSLTVTIDASDATNAQKNPQWTRQIFDDNGIYAADLSFDASANAFKVSDITLGGGYVELFGNIFNTGIDPTSPYADKAKHGQIQVFDGSGTITINNTTNYDLKVSELDTGSNQGIVRITDTSRTTKAGDNITTEFTSSNGKVSQVSYVMKDGKRDPQAAVLSNGDQSLYVTTPGRILHWITEVTTSEKDHVEQAKDGTKTYGPNITADTLSTEELKGGYFLEEGTEGKRDPNEVSRVVQKDANGNPMEKLNYGEMTDQPKGSGKDRQQWDTYYVVVTDYHYVKNASVPIKVSFFGKETGTVQVNTQKGLSLGDKIDSHNGVVSLAASGISQSSGVSIASKTVSLSATNGHLGQDQTPLIVNASGAVNATAALNGGTANISLSTTVGDLRIDKIQASGVVHLNSTGAITGIAGHTSGLVVLTPNGGKPLQVATDQMPHIVAQNITLKANGSIAGENGQALSVTNLDSQSTSALMLTATSGAGDISLSAPTLTKQDNSVVPLLLSINTLTAKNGNVTLYAPSATILDGNSTLTVDPLNQQQQQDLWSQGGLTHVSSDELDRRQDSLENALTQQYFQIWSSVGYKQTNYNPAYAFTFSADDKSAMLAKGLNATLISNEENRRTKAYHDTLKDPAAVYNPTYSYVLTADQKQNLKQAQWNAQSMLKSIPVSTAAQTGLQPGHGAGVNEDPNIVGGQVKITAASIGLNLATEHIPTGMDWPNMNSDQQMALRMASALDVKNSSTETTVNWGEDLDLVASEFLTVVATGPTRIYSDQDLHCKDLSLTAGAIITSYQNLDIASGTLSGDLAFYAWGNLSYFSGLNFVSGKGRAHLDAGGAVNTYTTPAGGPAGMLGVGLGPKATQINNQARKGWSLEQLSFALGNLPGLAGLDYHMSAKRTHAPVTHPQAVEETQAPLTVIHQELF